MANKIHIGTSGWQYKHWRGTFYPEAVKVKDHFVYYSEHFETVEINSSFYRLPTEKTFTKWYNQVPENFKYGIKANRYITHMKKLKDPGETLKKFLSSVTFLKGKLGPILYQLPPSLALDIELLKEFLKYLPKNLRHTFEFRNDSWYNEEVYNILENNNCAFCIYELGGHLSPEKVTADFIYIYVCTARVKNIRGTIVIRIWRNGV